MMNGQQGNENESRQNYMAPTGDVPPPPPQVASPPQYYRADPRRKSPLVAVVLSLMPGLGQVYLGYYQQGFINVLVIASLITMLASGIGGLAPLAGLFLAFYWLYNLVDAGRRASLYNQALAGLEAGALPEEVNFPSRHGTLLGGIALVVFGCLFFAHTKLDYSLEWLEDWWPLFLVILGAYLITKDVIRRYHSDEE